MAKELNQEITQKNDTDEEEYIFKLVKCPSFLLLLLLRIQSKQTELPGHWVFFRAIIIYCMLSLTAQTFARLQATHRREVGPL